MRRGDTTSNIYLDQDVAHLIVQIFFFPNPMIFFEPPKLLQLHGPPKVMILMMLLFFFFHKGDKTNMKPHFNCYDIRFHKKLPKLLPHQRIKVQKKQICAHAQGAFTNYVCTQGWVGGHQKAYLCLHRVRGSF